MLQKLDHVPFLLKKRAQTSTDRIASSFVKIKSLSDAKADLLVKQASTMRQTHESPQSKCTVVEEILTMQPQQTVVSQSGKTIGSPSRLDNFVT